MINTLRASVEMTFGRLKMLFNIIAGPYRGDLEKMSDLFYACAQLTNVDIQFHPLFKKR